MAEEVEPDACVATDDPFVRGDLAHFTMTVAQSPGERFVGSAHAHGDNDMLDDVFMPFTYTRRNEVGRRAHARRGAIADAPGELHDCLGVGALAVENRRQIAIFGQRRRGQRRVAPRECQQFDLHGSLVFSVSGLCDRL